MKFHESNYLTFPFKIGMKIFADSNIFSNNEPSIEIGIIIAINEIFIGVKFNDNWSRWYFSDELRKYNEI